MSLPIYRPLMTLRLLDHSKICMYLYNFCVEYQAQSMTTPCSKKTAPYPKSHTQNCATINELEIEPTPTHCSVLHGSRGWRSSPSSLHSLGGGSATLSTTAATSRNPFYRRQRRKHMLVNHYHFQLYSTLPAIRCYQYDESRIMRHENRNATDQVMFVKLHSASNKRKECDVGLLKEREYVILFFCMPDDKLLICLNITALFVNPFYTC